jgi:CRISPR/Cas system-associated protein Cas7 (RAMP superfamily)
MAATRTQVYLTEDQRRLIERRSRRTGESLAHMVREALDAYLVDDERALQAALDETYGAEPDFEIPSRSEWERGADTDR